MKCPKCGNELKISKKDPTYMLCYDCRKKFKIKAQPTADVNVKTEADRAETAAKDTSDKADVDNAVDKGETKIFSRKKRFDPSAIGARRRIKDGAGETVPEKPKKKKIRKPEETSVENTEEPADETITDVPAAPASEPVVSDITPAAEPAEQTSPDPVCTSSDDDEGDFHLRYANIPPKEIRDKQAQEMKKAYDELLAIGEEERSRKRFGFFRKKK